MTLEKEIKQSRPFTSKKEQAIVNIIFTSNWYHINENSTLKKFGISNQQYNVLRILNGQKGNPITINEIIDRMLDKMSNASRLVDKLFQKGLVERTQKPDNRRACDVVISNKGIDFLASMNIEIKKLESKIGLDDEEQLDLLNSLLDSFRKKKK